MSSNDPNTNPGGDGERVTLTEARQGFRDKPILWVLGGGLVLVILAFGILYALSAGPFASTQPHNARQPTDAAAFDTPQSPPKMNDIGHPSPRTGEPANTGQAVQDAGGPPPTTNAPPAPQ